MPTTPIVYDDVEVIEADGIGLTCRIGVRRVFVGKYVPMEGTTVQRRGDCGRLALPRWFVEQEALPLDRCLTETELEDWQGSARLKAAAAQKCAEAHPKDGAAQEALTRATNELAAAMLLRARRQGPGSC
jgi:hypothetical protein